MFSNTDITYRIHNSPPPILSQINLLHVFPSHFLKIYFNIIIPSTPRSFKWTLSLRFSHQTLYVPLLFPFVLHFRPTSFFFIRSPRPLPSSVSPQFDARIWLSCVLLTVNTKRLLEIHRIYSFKIFLALYEY